MGLSRSEDILESIINGVSYDGPAMSRIEKLLVDLGDLVRADSMRTDADVQAVILSYLQEHPEIIQEGLTLDDIPLETSNNPVKSSGIYAAIRESLVAKKYGVSGIGQSASALTRIWDSVGKTAQVGTDGDNSNVVNDFDNLAPFNRRKCVGTWSKVDGRSVFTVNAYHGDADYTEDGTMGDYVAVECPRAYYYLKDGTLGVSASHYPDWEPFDIFCKDHDKTNTIPYYYAPAYALAVKNGHAVSLPGLDNLAGSYKSLTDAARTYDGDGVEELAFLQPSAFNFYEWALYTVEFAVQNSQSIMAGCSSLRHNADDRATLRSDGKWLLNNYQAGRVAGEYISIQDTTVDIYNNTYYSSHRISSIIRCDETGAESNSGSYQLIETEDLGVGRTYTVGSSYRIAARPYRTGSTNTVSTPSGSPTHNTNGYYPCKYRWHENPFGNQFKTAADLFDVKNGTGDSDYYLEWYYLPDPSLYTPASASNPNAAELSAEPFVKLDVSTTHENYKDGYIKTKTYSDNYPNIWIPNETTGGSSTTYFADYAYLVISNVVRSVRFGGYWSIGATAGFSYVIASIAPSHASAYSGGDLYFKM